MSNSPPLLLAFSLVFLISSCATDFGEGPLTVVPINEGKIELRVAEFHRNEGVPPVVGILMSSEQIFGCMNYSILHLLHQRGNDIHLSIHGATIGPICATALGPATAINFPDLPVGSYSFRVMMNGRNDRYDLTITHTAIRLSPMDTSISRPMEQLSWRYPKSSFAFYAGTMLGDEWLVAAFVDSLKQRIPVQEISAPTDGRWPYARTVAGYAWNATPRYFVYQHEGHFDLAVSVLKEFAERYLRGRSGVGFWIENWMRQSYFSWILMNQKSSHSPNHQ